jgi:hypothetical protein
LTITGEDVGVMLDMEEKPVQHPAQDEFVIVNKIILSYAHLGLVPLVIPPLLVDPPLPIERTPVQQGTDLQYLNQMAERHGYLFYITPGPLPLQNTAYWGPPRQGVPQKALSANMGPDTNVEEVNFENDSLVPTLVSGTVQDGFTNMAMRVEALTSTRTPLSRQPAWSANLPNVRRRQLRLSGLSSIQAFARAQGIVDSSQDSVTAAGSLNTLQYGALLWPRGLVGLRGAGGNYDGAYYVKSVTHAIRMNANEYNQRFTLTRGGTQALVSKVTL